MALIDFTLSNARRFYSSMENPLGVKGLKDQGQTGHNSNTVAQGCLTCLNHITANILLRLSNYRCEQTATYL